MHVQRVISRSPGKLPDSASISSHSSLARVWGTGEAVWVFGWMTLGLLLRVWSLGRFPLREDEALYAYWARLISSGQDTMLEWVAVDKPPFFIYTLARFFEWFGPSVETGLLLNLLASCLALILLWLLARRIYGSITARWALAFFALSPFAISFAPTLYTDPMLVTWLLLALLAASYGSGLGAGLALGMAFATKQNALLFAPLLLGAVLLGTYASTWQIWLKKTGIKLQTSHLPLRPLTSILRLLTFATGFYYIWFKVWQWDGWRILPSFIPSFWEQSWNSYGGLALVEPAQWPVRIAQWWEVGQWLGGWVVGTTLVAGLIIVGLIERKPPRKDTEEQPLINSQRSRANEKPSDFRSPTSSSRYWSLLFVVFVLAYLLLHIVLSFQAWDRYLLGLTPLLALLAAHGFVTGWEALRSHQALRWGLALAVGFSLLWGAGQAATARIPIGGDHGAYAGIEEVAEYLQKRVPAQRGVLYQRWLGWHWNWYLWDGPAGRVYWAEPAMLLDDIRTSPEGYTRYVVFPSWHVAERERLNDALAEDGLSLTERLVVNHPEDGRLQFAVYEIVSGDGDLSQ
jgi:4-amino-4-deoxy-L-arabinose transferase-like glycosyltransferase